VAPNDRMVSEHWTGRDVDGSGHVPIRITILIERI